MNDTIGAVMRTCRHYFPVDWLDGEWSVKGGVISPKMLDGVIAITGSMRLNGVWEVVDGKIAAECDEDWHGRVWVLAPPEDFLALCREIDAWREEHPAQALRSERFGEYACEFAADKDGSPLGWQAVFARQLGPFQRMYAEVNIEG